MASNANNEAFKKEIGDKGNFVRPDRSFRGFVTATPGKFTAEPGRYHLYVALLCPWANRTIAVRKLKGLEDAISLDVVHPILDKSTGWSFKQEIPGTTGDSINHFEFLKSTYLESDPAYDQSVTVPVLYDKKLKQIVNNESSEIIRMLNSEFNEFAKNKTLDLYPENLRSEIDSVNSWIYNEINNGVYKSGFAQTQAAYDEAVRTLFKALDRVEDILSKKRFLVGDAFTEADVRLFQTLIRFDVAYHNIFKCNKKRIVDYPNIWNYTKEIYQMDGISETVNFDHIKHYYNLKHLNPFEIIPIGPDLDLTSPHNRNEVCPINKKQ